MSDEHSKQSGVIPPAPERATKAKASAKDSQSRRPVKRIDIEDLNLTREELELFARGARFLFGQPDSENDDELSADDSIQAPQERN